MWSQRAAWLLAIGGLLAGLGVPIADWGGPRAFPIFVAILALVAATSMRLGIHGRPAPARRTRLRVLGQRLERAIEQLKDLQWELRDHHHRYRDLLDSQSDLITRRDSTGRLTFVNRAFCQSFAVDAADVLGTKYQPLVLDGDPSGPMPEGIERHDFEQNVATAVGPRWFAFECRRVPCMSKSDAEVQCVGRDVTHARMAQAELSRARDSAQASNQAKSRFLAAMSHEIRTPMNGILGMSSLLLDTELSGDQKAYADAIDRSAKSLLGLIDEILDFSKIEAGKLEIIASPFRLDECVQGAVELMAPKAREKGLELAWLMERDAPCQVIGDETRVRQILLNLIGNAVKFTDCGGVVVRVAAKAVGDAAGEVQLFLSVADTGIGIEPAALRSLFVEFEQSDAVPQRHRGGTGLGLAISRRLARAMGGDVTVESRPGVGSTFVTRLVLRVAASANRHLADATGRLPPVLLALNGKLERHVLKETMQARAIKVTEINQPDPAAMLEFLRTGPRHGAVIADANNGLEAARTLLAAARQVGDQSVKGIVLIGMDGKSELPAFRAAGFDAYLVRPVRPGSLFAQLGAARGSTKANDTRPNAGAERRPALRRNQHKRVLLVEDNDINALLAMRMAERSNASTTLARNGHEAVDHCEQVAKGLALPFDVVLMDVHMPQMDGFEAASRVRESHEAADLQAPPIIALTANAFPEDRKRCLEAGFDDYLAKPFEKRELEAMLDKWCGSGSNRGGTLDDFAA